MTANPNDVVSLLIVNIDNAPPTQYDTVFKAAAIDSLAFAPESSPIQASSWPTLGSLIDSGKRLVVFLDNQANIAVVPYLIDEFTNIWETAFNVVDPALFDCSVNRTKGDTATQMYLINHFLDKIFFGQPVPDVANANVTNAASGPGSLGAHVDTCVAINTRAPNFLLVDVSSESFSQFNVDPYCLLFVKFYEYGGGSVFEVAASINQVTYTPTSPIATPVPTTGAAAPSGSSKAGNSNSAFSMSPRTHVLESLGVVAGIAFGAYAVL
ncbi:hypothetical protein DXG03_008078 [Asterophora parasitica]|uniref:Uncharacterized protein n=1 Tax=Asterophora parasitica TaxID=117018 RepID=A0A9P7G896_9AGAR|nr:hypothetical protein DXG03_008078 [Asterophora parasitica]